MFGSRITEIADGRTALLVGAVIHCFELRDGLGNSLFFLGKLCKN